TTCVLRWTGSRRSAKPTVSCGSQPRSGASGTRRGIWWKAAVPSRTRSERTSVRRRLAPKPPPGGGAMGWPGGDIPRGARWAREALELHQELGDPSGAAFSRLMVAYATGREGDWPRAEELFGESVRQFRELGDRHYALRAARAHAWAHYEDGDLDGARALFEA